MNKLTIFMQLFSLLLTITRFTHSFPFPQVQNASNFGVDKRIIGGEIARSAQFPFAAAIWSQSSNSQIFCGGAIITNQWILTAGHCIYGATLFTIQLGSNSLQGTDSHRVTLASGSSAIHPNFDIDELDYDIGLIRLRMPIEFSTYITAIELPAIPIDDTSASVTAIGWGQLDDMNSGLSNDLQYVGLNAIPNKECELAYGDQITQRMLCVSGNFNEGMCTSDSGSPLIEYRNSGRIAVHVGIASFVSSRGCETSEPSGYARTYAYLDWIRSVINQ